jgi:drug/metabolite transporter (DMT)-like permease
MQPTVVALVLASALVHAGWNALLKRSREPETAAVAMMTTCMVFTNAIAIAVGSPIPPGRALAWSVGSGLFEAGYLVALARAMSSAPLSVVYTIARGGALVVVWPVSVAVLGERAGALGVAGVALVMVGLAFAASSPKKPDAPKTSTAGIVWALLAAFFIAGYLLCYKGALAEGGAPTSCVAVSLTLGWLGLAMRHARRWREVVRVVRESPVSITAAGFLANGSFVLFLFGLQHGGTGATSTLRNASVIFAQGFAWLIGERPRRAHVFGAVLVAVGAASLAWPHS